MIGEPLRPVPKPVRAPREHQRLRQVSAKRQAAIDAGEASRGLARSAMPRHPTADETQDEGKLAFVPKSRGNLTGRQTGFIARDVEKVFSEWVGVDAKGFKTITVTGFEPLVVEAVRAISQENADLRARVSRLEQQGAVLASARTAR